jgi:hypothetical protein
MSQTASFSPNKGPVGTVTTVSGTGWTGDNGGAIGPVTVGGETVLTHSLVASEAGVLSGEMTIPTIVGHGPQDVTICGFSSGTITFTGAWGLSIQQNSLNKTYPS